MLTVKAMTIIVDSLPPRPKLDYDVGYDMAMKGTSIVVAGTMAKDALSLSDGMPHWWW